MKKIIFSITLTLIINIVPVFSQTLQYGQDAPELKLEKILQTDQLELDIIPFAKGKIVVVDFWTTWCSPCIKEFPHLNQLVKTFEKDPVIFLSISNEQERLVTNLLKKHPLNSWIGLDYDLSTFKKYNAWAIPKMVIIDKKGKLAAVLHPHELNEYMIKQLLSGKTLSSKGFKDGAYHDPLGAERQFRKMGNRGASE